MGNFDFLAGAPKFLTNRFNSVNKYVSESITPSSLLKDRIGRKRTIEARRKEGARLKSITDEAAIVVFLFLLNKFFKEGSRAAIDAVDTFKELNIDGFYIGSNFFSGRNEKVMQGERIAEVLMNSIKDEKVKDLISDSKYVSDILNQYKLLI